MLGARPNLYLDLERDWSMKSFAKYAYLMQSNWWSFPVFGTQFLGSFPHFEPSSGLTSLISAICSSLMSGYSQS